VNREQLDKLMKAIEGSKTSPRVLDGMARDAVDKAFDEHRAKMGVKTPSEKERQERVLFDILEEARWKLEYFQQLADESRQEIVHIEQEIRKLNPLNKKEE
jgi:hypothetical protein